jgi:uncharacterized protein with PhoU and TrkA domain
MPALSDRHVVLLELGDAYEIEAHRIAVTPEVTVRGLRGLEQSLEGVKVLGVRRGDEYFGEPPVDVTLSAGDELIVYGRRDVLDRIGQPA